MEYHTPQEEQLAAAHEQRVQAVLDQAARDYASCQVAMELGEPPAVVERWINAMWDGLRANLTDGKSDAGMRMDDRLTAILLLLHPRATGEADSILRGMRECGDA